MFIILGSIIILFVALYIVVDYKNKQALELAGNLYGKDQLKQETIDQLDNPLYQNQITSKNLDEKLASQEDVVVYFYSPVCIYCVETTPILVPLAEELGIDVKMLNLYEFQDQQKKYNIQGTPTLIYFANGKEVDRVYGKQTKEIFSAFFEEYGLEKQ